MAEITLTNPYYYQDNAGGVSAVIGWDGVYYRIARYEFTTSNTGASHISFTFPSFQYASGTSISDSNLCFYIGTSNTSHEGANANSEYTGKITVTQNASGLCDFSGEADIVLLPNTKYYFWIFSNSAKSTLKYAFFYDNESKSIAATGGAGLVRIDNGSGFEMYQAYIDNGASWDLYMPYIDNGTKFEIYS